MACKLTLTLLSESQTGTIGNDWQYSIEVKILGAGDNQALLGRGTLEVPEHTIESGATQPPPGPPQALVLPAGPAGGPIRVDLRIKAEEVDLVQNDVGETTASFKMTCPAAGAAAVVEEREVAVGVEEAPSSIGNAILKLTYRVSLEHD